MDIHFESNRQISIEEFVDLLNRSSLAERRPVSNGKCMAAMLAHADILCTAWDGGKLVGIARSITDFEYCCYLSDLAVDVEYQGQGVGKELIRLTQSQLGSQATLILLSAPKAVNYYPRIGFVAHPSAWTIAAQKKIE